MIKNTLTLVILLMAFTSCETEAEKIEREFREGILEPGLIDTWFEGTVYPTKKFFVFFREGTFLAGTTSGVQLIVQPSEYKLWKIKEDQIIFGLEDKSHFYRQSYKVDEKDYRTIDGVKYVRQ